MSMGDLSEELASLVRRLYATELMRMPDEIGGVELSFIANNRLYRLFVQTEESPDEFTLSAGAENPFLEAASGVMTAFLREMRRRHPSAGYGPRGPHGADFGAQASGRRGFGLPLEAEFKRCKQTVDLCLDGTSAVISSLDRDD